MTDDLARAQKRGDERQIKYEETRIASLKEAERTWISYRDIQCKAAAQQYEGGSIAPMAYSQCLDHILPLIDDRRGRVEHLNGDPRVAGVQAGYQVQ